MLIETAAALVETSRLIQADARAAQGRSVTLRARCHQPGRIAAPVIAAIALPRPTIKRATERRQHDRLSRPGRRLSDHRPSAADNRRVLLVSSDSGWRRLTAYLVEEAGYVAYAAEDADAPGLTATLLPDVVVVAMAPQQAIHLLARLVPSSTTADIPIVVLTASLHGPDAERARAAGGVTVLPHTTEIDVLVGEVDTLVAVAPRARRVLRRRLLDLQELARHYPPDAEGRAALRRLIDRLQLAVIALDDHGQCIAASYGATRLTGYSHRTLLTASVFQDKGEGGDVSHPEWQNFLASREYVGAATITAQGSKPLTVHASMLSELMPGVHVAVLGGFGGAVPSPPDHRGSA